MDFSSLGLCEALLGAVAEQGYSSPTPIQSQAIPAVLADLTQKETAEHGRVRSMNLARDIFSGRCRGFGFIEMEGHEARAAMNALNGQTLRGNSLRVHEERPRGRSGGRGRR